MTPKLTDEQREALTAGNGEAMAEDEHTNRVYVITDLDTHRQAMEALRQKQNHDAIAEGLADMEAGRGMPAHEADDYLRQKLSFPPKSIP